MPGGVPEVLQGLLHRLARQEGLAVRLTTLEQTVADLRVKVAELHQGRLHDGQQGAALEA